MPLRWQGETQLHVPSAGCLVQFDAVTGEGLQRSLLASTVVTLGVRQGGERLRLHPGGPHRSLKNLLQEQAIPPWQRARLPLLWCDGQLVWAAGIGCDPAALALPGETGIMPRMVALPTPEQAG
jgi:tRNA(Ile)-lysidine synthase